MNHDVVWLPEAMDQLADIWKAAADKDAVTEASFQINARLEADPLNEGESRGEIERITFHPPLRILFRVFEADRTVEVHDVAVFGKPPRP